LFETDKNLTEISTCPLTSRKRSKSAAQGNFLGVGQKFMSLQQDEHRHSKSALAQRAVSLYERSSTDRAGCIIAVPGSRGCRLEREAISE